MSEILLTEKHEIFSADWFESIWVSLVTSLSKALRLTTIEKLQLEKSWTAQLVAAIPYAAGCEYAERTALSHLATFYIGSSRGKTRKVFDHTKEDDDNIYRRLLLGMNFVGGNKKIIMYGMAALALTMVEGYYEDREHDKVCGQYNPFVSGAWDYKKVRAVLEEDMRKGEEGGLKNLAEKIIKMGFWWN